MCVCILRVYACVCLYEPFCVCMCLFNHAHCRILIDKNADSICLAPDVLSRSGVIVVYNKVLFLSKKVKIKRTPQIINIRQGIRHLVLCKTSAH